jgi:hypothetical protein
VYKELQYLECPVIINSPRNIQKKKVGSLQRKETIAGQNKHGGDISYTRKQWGLGEESLMHALWDASGRVLWKGVGKESEES